VTQIEVGKPLPIGAVLPPMTPRATVTSDSNGKFTLVIRSTKPWMLQVDEPTEPGFVPGSTRIKVPEDLRDRRELSLLLSIDHGRILNRWER
jgi:hypothetical protein